MSFKKKWFISSVDEPNKSDHLCLDFGKYMLFTPGGHFVDFLFISWLFFQYLTLYLNINFEFWTTDQVISFELITTGIILKKLRISKFKATKLAICTNQPKLYKPT